MGSVISLRLVMGLFETLALVYCFATLLVLLNRKTQYHQRQLYYAIFGFAIYHLGALVEIKADTIRSALSGRFVESIGYACFMLGLMAFISTLCSIRIPKYFTFVLFFFDAMISFLLFWESDWQIFYSSRKLVKTKDFVHLVTTSGLGDMLFWIFVVGVPYVTCGIILIYAIYKEKNGDRSKEYRMLFALQIICGVLTFSFNHNFINPAMNPTVGIASIIICTLVHIFWRAQGFDIISAVAIGATDSLNAGIITLDKFDKIVYFNESAKKIYPFLDAYKGKSIYEVDELGLNETFKETKIAESNINDRRYQLSLSEIIPGSDSVAGYGILINDMTETLEVMDRLRDEQAKVVEANKTKDLFMANVSHDIRTPVNAIVGLSELIIEESRGRKVYDMALTIKNASLGLLDFVNNIMDMSNIQGDGLVIEEQEYYLADVLGDVSNLLQVAASQKGISLVSEIDENLPSVLVGDGVKLRQVIMNLVSNGIRYTNDGFVKLSVTGVRHGAEIALCIEVQDTGVGFKKDELKNLFGVEGAENGSENNVTESNGVGLQITKKFVEFMGGVISVDSVYGQGTTFTVRLSQKISNNVSISETAGSNAEGERLFTSPETSVLIVDDNAVNLMVASNVLEPYGMHVHTVESGAAALEEMRKKKYDIVLMDHMMPGMDGIETTRRMRQYYDSVEHHPIIIALTANAFTGAREMFLSNGFDDFMSKPVEKLAMYHMLVNKIPESKRKPIDAVISKPLFSEDDLAEIYMRGVDSRAAIKNNGGGIDEYMNLVEIFFMEGTQKLAKMKTYLNEEDVRNYEILVHGLKSTAAIIGAKEISDKAREHEMAAKDGNKQYLEQHFDELCRLYEDVLSEINGVLKKRQKIVAKEAKKMQSIPKEDLITALSEILAASESFKTKEAQEKINNLMQYKLDANVEDTLDKVRKKYKVYDDDGAEATLKELIEQLSL